MYQNVPNLRPKLSKLTITYRVTFAPQARLSTSVSWESWAPMSAGDNDTYAPLLPKPWREVHPEMPPSGQVGWFL